MGETHLEPHLTNPVAAVWWDTEIRSVFLQWSANPSDDQYKVILDAGLDLMAKKGGSVWLSDARGLTITRPLAQEWAKSDWIPRAQAAGMQQLVIVLPHDEWASTVATTGVRTIFDVFDPQYFPTVPEARQWIRNQG